MGETGTESGALGDNYTAQLEQVKELLRLDPGNTELVQLQTSLEEVIQLQQQVSEAQAVGPSSAAGEGGNSLEWPEGGMCEAFFSKSWFPAVVKSVERGGAGGGTVIVEFLGYGNTETVDVASLRALSGERTLDPAECLPGFACRGKYAVDEQWYDAVVEAPTARGFRIKFSEYGNVEEVPIEWIQAHRPPAEGSSPTGSNSRPASPVDELVGLPAGNSSPFASLPGHTTTSTPHAANASSSVPSAEGSVAAAVVAADGTFVIPDHLKVLPTDTEEQRAKKRKKVKALKLANKGKEDELARKSKQQSWQKFQKKASKKRTKGFMGAAVKKDSLFATPDSVHGKVGVMNSGQGTTEFAVRKKYKLG